MNILPKKFALFGNVYQSKKSAHVLRLLSILEKYQAEVFIEKEFYQFLTQDQQMDIHTAGVFSKNDFQADMVLSMGGDGTFLKAASRVGNKNIPILGINTGRLGFLADVSPEEMEEVFDDSASAKDSAKTNEAAANKKALQDQEGAANKNRVPDQEGAASYAIGRAWFQAPEVDGNIVIRAARVKEGAVVKVRAVAVSGVDIYAELLG